MFSTKWMRIMGVSAAFGFSGLSISRLTVSLPDVDTDSLSVVRLGRAVCTALNIAMCYKTKLYSSTLDVDSPEYEKLRSDVHCEAAHMLLKLCRLNKGVYIKVGQHVGTLDYLVPHEYINVLAVLHSDAPQSPIESVYKVLREDLKEEPSEIFESFEDEPLGTASLAQVHKAVLKDGTTVAVKVQHEVVQRNSVTDLFIMEVLVKIMAVLFKDFKFQWLVDETKLMLPKELDFTNEADNNRKVKELFCSFKWLKIPDVYPELSTSRVLTMEFVEGAKVTDLKYIRENNINPMDISKRLGELYANMIFRDGFVHSDPHPGNILIRKNEKNKLVVVLLDHGLYANLTDEFRLNYAKLWLSILRQDRKGMQVYSEKMGIKELYPLLVCMVTGRTWESVNKGISKVEYTKEEQEEFKRKMPIFLTRIGDVLQTVNRELLLILKANDLLRGIEFSLKIDKRQASFLVMTKCCVNSLYEERKKQCQYMIKKVYLSVSRAWAIFKINVYYTYLIAGTMIGLI
ncbi:UNVERIFIED_CONTAM: hypothetical protein PYX00_003726 [Menopon gallinae]|uniref:ABC1 atypical kinase-like domain-containing protein n=1 Tax=Menopon gallinae TaxID=328185 RepID=A0AAW2I2V2_9NEOP